jgi:glycosyltransferase involved in cell wall biosynthesis
VRIVRQVRRGRYDAVVLNGSIDLWLTALGAWALVRLSGRTGVAHVCHNVRPFNRWGGEELFASSRLLHALLRRVYPAFDLVFLHGERSLEEFERVWPGARAAVVPHGDERLFAGEPPPPASEPRAVFFGDWRKVKGLAVLMAAFDEVLEGMPQARLTIAGDPSPEEGQGDAVLAWAAQKGESVETIAGYVPVEEVAGVFARARLVVLPYLVGYQSGVLHVAMTMARAVVASDVGDLAATVVPGQTGLLVAPGDVHALAQAITTVLADAQLAERMGAAGHRQLGERADWTEVAARMSAALRGMSANASEDVGERI